MHYVMVVIMWGPLAVIIRANPCQREVEASALLSMYITLQNKFVIRQIQKCPMAKYIVHLKFTVK